MAAQQLRSVRDKFVKNVKEAIVSQLLDDLVQDGVLNLMEKDYINQKYPIIADKARQLTDVVISKGDDASSKMIAHLLKRNPTPYSELRGSCSQPPQSAQKLFGVRKMFIDNVIDPIVSQLLTDLVQDGVLNQGEKDYINQKYPVTADKAGQLVDAVMKKGDVASSKMITRLNERDPTLYSKMGLSCIQPPQPAVQVKKNTEWSTTLIPATDALWNEKRNDPHIYPVDKKSIGKRVALLITNIKFTHLLNRDGAERDEENMEKLLSDLRYEVVKHRNLTAQEIDNELIQFSEHPKLRETDSVVVVIMSHGKRGVLIGVNYKEEEPTDVFPIDNIYKHLGSEECPALLNRPKIIIIQACRGGQEGAVFVSDSASQGLVCDDASQPGAEGEMEEDALRHVHREKDFISLLSSTPGTVSYRHPVFGSVFIQAIVNVFYTFASQDDIEELFRKVMQHFEESMHGSQMLTIDRCTLTESFYFFPGY